MNASDAPMEVSAQNEVQSFDHVDEPDRFALGACCSSSSSLQNSAALYLLTLKEKYKVTQRTVDFSVD